MGFGEIYGAVVLGIIPSIVGPLLRKVIPTQVELTESQPYFDRIKPFLAIGAFSLLTALLVVAFLGDTLGTERALPGITARLISATVVPAQ